MFKGQFLNGAHKQQRIPTFPLNVARIRNEKARDDAHLGL